MTVPAENQNTTPNTSEVEKLWAGKYKTPEEMENAIKAKDTEYTKLSETNKNLQKEHDETKSKYESVTKPPSEYTLPQGSEEVSDRMEDLKSIAKNSGLSQEHFNKLVEHEIASVRQAKESFETTKKSIPSETLVILEDYVKKVYPESVRADVMRKLISDSSARNEALTHREQLLNSKVPGMSNSRNEGGDGKNSEAYDGQKEVADLASAYLRKKSDTKTRDKLIDKAREVGEARFKK